MADVARITICERLPNGGEQVRNILEFEVPADAAKRRRKLMTQIGKLVDESATDREVSSLTIIFADIGSN